MQNCNQNLDDTKFLYFNDAFFKNYISRHYGPTSTSSSTVRSKYEELRTIEEYIDTYIKNGNLSQKMFVKDKFLIDTNFTFYYLSETNSYTSANLPELESLFLTLSPFFRFNMVGQDKTKTNYLISNLSYSDKTNENNPLIVDNYSKYVPNLFLEYCSSDNNDIFYEKIFNKGLPTKSSVCRWSAIEQICKTGFSINNNKLRFDLAAGFNRIGGTQTKNKRCACITDIYANNSQASRYLAQKVNSSSEKTANIDPWCLYSECASGYALKDTNISNNSACSTMAVAGIFGNPGENTKVTLDNVRITATVNTQSESSVNIYTGQCVPECEKGTFCTNKNGGYGCVPSSSPSPQLKSVKEDTDPPDNSNGNGKKIWIKIIVSILIFSAVVSGGLLYIKTHKTLKKRGANVKQILLVCLLASFCVFIFLLLSTHYEQYTRIKMSDNDINKCLYGYGSITNFAKKYNLPSNCQDLWNNIQDGGNDEKFTKCLCDNYISKMDVMNKYCKYLMNANNKDNWNKCTPQNKNDVKLLCSSLLQNPVDRGWCCATTETTCNSGKKNDCKLSPGCAWVTGTINTNNNNTCTPRTICDDIDTCGEGDCNNECMNNTCKCKFGYYLKGEACSSVENNYIIKNIPYLPENKFTGTYLYTTVLKNTIYAFATDCNFKYDGEKWMELPTIPNSSQQGFHPYLPIVPNNNEPFVVYSSAPTGGESLIDSLRFTCKMDIRKRGKCLGRGQNTTGPMFYSTTDPDSLTKFDYQLFNPPLKNFLKKNVDVDKGVFLNYFYIVAKGLKDETFFPSDIKIKQTDDERYMITLSQKIAKPYNQLEFYYIDNAINEIYHNNNEICILSTRPNSFTIPTSYTNCYLTNSSLNTYRTCDNQTIPDSFIGAIKYLNKWLYTNACISQYKSVPATKNNFDNSVFYSIRINMDPNFKPQTQCNDVNTCDYFIKPNFNKTCINYEFGNDGNITISSNVENCKIFINQHECNNNACKWDTTNKCFAELHTQYSIANNFNNKLEITLLGESTIINSFMSKIAYNIINGGHMEASVQENDYEPAVLATIKFPPVSNNIVWGSLYRNHYENAENENPKFTYKLTIDDNNQIELEFIFYNVTVNFPMIKQDKNCVTTYTHTICTSLSSSSMVTTSPFVQTTINQTNLSILKDDTWSTQNIVIPSAFMATSQKNIVVHTENIYLLYALPTNPKPICILYNAKSPNGISQPVTYKDNDYPTLGDNTTVFTSNEGNIYIASYYSKGVCDSIDSSAPSSHCSQSDMTQTLCNSYTNTCKWQPPQIKIFTVNFENDGVNISKQFTYVVGSFIPCTFVTNTFFDEEDVEYIAVLGTQDNNAKIYIMQLSTTSFAPTPMLFPFNITFTASKLPYYYFSKDLPDDPNFFGQNPTVTIKINKCDSGCKKFSVNNLTYDSAGTDCSYVSHNSGGFILGSLTCTFSQNFNIEPDMVVLCTSDGETTVITVKTVKAAATKDWKEIDFNNYITLYTNKETRLTFYTPYEYQVLSQILKYKNNCATTAFYKDNFIFAVNGIGDIFGINISNFTTNVKGEMSMQPCNGFEAYGEPRNCHRFVPQGCSGC